MKAPKQSKSAAEGHKSQTRQPFLQRKPGAADRPFIASPTAPQIHPKLTVNQPGDHYEQEADQMAERVMRMPSENEAPPMISRMRAGGPVQRKCAACEAGGTTCSSCAVKEKEKAIQRQSTSSEPTHAPDTLAQRLQARRGQGAPLSPTMHQQMGGAFGQDFSGVRLHTDAEAVQMSRELNAQAFTYGQDVYFGSGKYQPGTTEGRGLLGHELTHTVQQGGGFPVSIQLYPQVSDNWNLTYKLRHYLYYSDLEKSIEIIRQLSKEEKDEVFNSEIHRKRLTDSEFGDKSVYRLILAFTESGYQNLFGCLDWMLAEFDTNSGRSYIEDIIGKHSIEEKNKIGGDPKMSARLIKHFSINELTQVASSLQLQLEDLIQWLFEKDKKEKGNQSNFSRIAFHVSGTGIIAKVAAILEKADYSVIQTAKENYKKKYDRDLTAAVIESQGGKNIPSVELIRAVFFLHSKYKSSYTLDFAIALFAGNPGENDHETQIYQILEQALNGLEKRKGLKDEYERIFYINKLTDYKLVEKIKRRFTYDAEKKILALFHHDLKKADELAWHITGDTDYVKAIAVFTDLIAEKGFEGIRELENDWNNYIIEPLIIDSDNVGSVNVGYSFHKKPLFEAVKETYGKSDVWKIIEPIQDGYVKWKFGQFASSVKEGINSLLGKKAANIDTDKNKANKGIEDDLLIDTAIRVIENATYDLDPHLHYFRELKDTNDPIIWAISILSSKMPAKINRATGQEKQYIQAQWQDLQIKIEKQINIHYQYDKSKKHAITAKLALYRDKSVEDTHLQAQADNFYANVVGKDKKGALRIAENIWAEDQVTSFINILQNSSVTSAGGEMLRPKFSGSFYQIDVKSFIKSYISDSYLNRIYHLINPELDQFKRGGYWLQHEVIHLKPDISILTHFFTLADSKPELLDKCIEHFIDLEKGDNKKGKYENRLSLLDEIEKRRFTKKEIKFELQPDSIQLVKRETETRTKINAEFLRLKDVLLPPKTDVERILRAIAYNQHQGVKKDNVLGYLAHRNIDRLIYMLFPAEAKALLAATGRESIGEQAEIEYRILKDRADKYRRDKEAEAALFAFIVELIVASVILLATGGTAGIVLAGLLSKVAGMAVKEAMLDEHYDLFSDENFKVLLTGVLTDLATAGIGAKFEKIKQTQRFKDLANAQKVMASMGKNVVEQVSSATIDGIVNDKLPNLEQEIIKLVVSTPFEGVKGYLDVSMNQSRSVIRKAVTEGTLDITNQTITEAAVASADSRDIDYRVLISGMTRTVVMQSRNSIHSLNPPKKVSEEGGLVNHLDKLGLPYKRTTDELTGREIIEVHNLDGSSFRIWESWHAGDPAMDLTRQKLTETFNALSPNAQKGFETVLSRLGPEAAFKKMQEMARSKEGLDATLSKQSDAPDLMALDPKSKLFVVEAEAEIRGHAHELRPSSMPGYLLEIPLGNNRFWRMNSDGVWCRFASPAVCSINQSLLNKAFIKTISPEAVAKNMLLEYKGRLSEEKEGLIADMFRNFYFGAEKGNISKGKQQKRLHPAMAESKALLTLLQENPTATIEVLAPRKGRGNPPKRTPDFKITYADGTSARMEVTVVGKTLKNTDPAMVREELALNIESAIRTKIERGQLVGDVKAETQDGGQVTLRDRPDIPKAGEFFVEITVEIPPGARFEDVAKLAIDNLNAEKSARLSRPADQRSIALGPKGQALLKINLSYKGQTIVFARKPGEAGFALVAASPAAAAAAIQPKLTVNQPGDRYEQEADQMAERVMRMPSENEAPPMISRMWAGGPVQRKCSACEQQDKEKQVVQRQPNDNEPTQASDDVAQRLQSRKGQGAPLPPSMNQRMGGIFGRDFSNVRLHTDAEAVQMSRDLNAQAFTHGQDIYFDSGKYQPETDDGKRLLGHELTHTVQQGADNHTVQRKQVWHDTTLAQAPKAEAFIAARFPHLISILDANQMKTIQKYLNYRVQKPRADFELKMFDTQNKISISHGQTMYMPGYDKKRAAISARYAKKPNETSIQIDTAKLLDRAILDEQPWNAAAEREFRERWVLKLASAPVTFNFEDWLSIDLSFDGPYWGEEKDALPTEGGLITFEKLLSIGNAWHEYYNEVKNSPLIQAVNSMQKEIRRLYQDTESEYELEVRRRADHPIVRRFSEFVGAVDFPVNPEAASAYLATHPNYDPNDPVQQKEFLKALTSEVALPSKSTWEKIVLNYETLENAYQQDWYEAVVMAQPLLAEKIGDFLLQTSIYRGRVLSGAGRIVQALEVIKAGSKITLTIGGGVAGKGLGLLGVSLGSGAGAGFSTLTQEIAGGNTDLGSIIQKTGKDAMITSISTLIGGALAGKFQALFNARLAAQIPNVGWRTSIADRVADLASGVLTTPIEMTINGMLEGKWPKNMDEFLDQVAANTIQSMVIGGGIDLAIGGFWRLNAPDLGTPTTGAGSTNAAITIGADPSRLPYNRSQQATTGDPTIDNEVITLFHGTSRTQLESLGALGDGKISVRHGSLNEDLGQGFYMSEYKDVATKAAEVRGKGGSHDVLQFDIRRQDLGVVVDVRRGGDHREVWDAFLDQPYAPGGYKMGTRREYLGGPLGIEKRGEFFEEFLKNINMKHADTIMGPIGDSVTTGAVSLPHESTQVLIRSQKVADRLNAIIRGEYQIP